MDVVTKVVESYKQAPARLQLIDAFMAFLVASGIAQFAFCVVFGNYPFNAFLAGFGANVAQFVLLASLRQQVDPTNSKEFSSISPKRAFRDFILGSLVLHFICWHFVN